MPTYALIQHLTDPLQSAAQDICNAISRAFIGDPEPALEHGLYSQVALMEAKGPEALYMATQSLDDAWFEVNPPLWRANRVRSTSVGDFIVETETGKVLLCAAIGWREMDPETSSRLRKLVLHASPDQR